MSFSQLAHHLLPVEAFAVASSEEEDGSTQGTLTSFEPGISTDIGPPANGSLSGNIPGAISEQQEQRQQ